MWGVLQRFFYQKSKEQNIGPKIFYCIFISYVLNCATYRFLILKSKVLEPNTITKARQTEFFKPIFPKKFFLKKKNLFVKLLQAWVLVKLKLKFDGVKGIELKNPLEMILLPLFL